MAHSVTYRYTRKLCWQITVDAVKPVTASEYTQFGDNVIVSAVTRQWILADQQLNLLAPAMLVMHDRRLQETENTQITCIIRYMHSHTL